MKKGLLLPLALILIITACSKAEDTNYLSYEEPNKNELWAYNDLSRFDNKDNLMAFYDVLDSKYSNFSKSTTNLNKTAVYDTTNDSPTYYYIIDKIKYPEYNIQEYEAISVVKAYSLDHPRYFWIDDDILSNDKDIALTCYSSYSNYDDRKKANDKIDNYIKNLQIALTKNLSTLQIIEKIHNYICDSAEYGYPLDIDDSFDSHNIIGITNYGKGVCESYAKLFQYLTNIFEIKSILVLGNAKTNLDILESHAWNLISYNNQWALVDTTWDDTANIYTNFFKDKDMSKNIYFPSNKNALADSEDFIYELPEISYKA